MNHYYEDNTNNIQDFIENIRNNAKKFKYITKSRVRLHKMKTCENNLDSYAKNIDEKIRSNLSGQAHS